MAEINTGLGWAAQDSYLIQSSGVEIARISGMGGPDFPNMPIAKNVETWADCIAQGTKVFYWRNPAEETIQYAACMDNVDCLICVLATSGHYAICAIAATPGARMCTAYIKNGQNTGWYPVSGSWALDTATGLYYYTFNSVGSLYYNYYSSNVTSFSTVRTALDAVIASNTSFTKDNAGYAVACVAKWKTSANTIIATPILISTDSSFTDMTDSSGQYNLAKLNILQQGVRFYMSFFDVVDPDAISTTFPVVDLTGEGQNPRSLEQVFATIADLDHAAILVLESPDPYNEEGANAGEEGGDGTDLDDDPVEEETLPLPSVAGHGFCTIYVPSSQELNQMSSYLWGGSFDVSQVIKLFSSPMDSILGLSAVPVDLVGSPEQIYLGGVALTGVTMPKYTGRTSVKVDFGSVTVAKRWGSYLDYSPYTDFSIYLPFIGIKSIKADDIMGKTVNLTYAIDILSGGCVAYLRPAGESVLYEWSGQCALQIPVTGRSYDNVFQSAMSVATAAFAAVTAPASAPVLSGAVASAAVQAAATKPHIERSGTVNGIIGFLGQLRPYLIRTIPEAYIPADQNKFIGYPAYINVDLATVTGYNEVDSIHLENVTATGAELEEIESILKGGVIF